MSDFVVYNGSVLSRDKVLVSPDNRGIMYGDGFFDTLRSYNGKFLLLESHFERILKTAEFLRIDVQFTYRDFRDTIIELLEANELSGSEALVRVQCWREGDRGYATSSSESSWFTTCKKLSVDVEPVTLITSSTRLIPSVSVPAIYKFSNGLNYIIAGNEARNCGADDALMLTTDGFIGETSIANVFWIKGNTVFTPSKDCDLLPGITRELVISLISEKSDLSLIEGRFEPEYLKDAEAVFCTNSVREIIPVVSLDAEKFEPGNQTLESIRSLFSDFKSKHLQ